MSEFKTLNSNDLLNKENSLHSSNKPSLILRSRTLEEVVSQEYGESISRVQELKESETSTKDCLNLHRVNEDLRSKMVDWMVEVLDIFNCSKRTFFLSVRIMDLFFKTEPSTIGIEELHVIGVACMMIASKYEDIKALDMKTIYYKIAHERLPKAYIVLIEKKILKVLDYKLFVPTVVDFLEPLLAGYCKADKAQAYLIAELAQLNGSFAWIKPSVLSQAVFFIVLRNVANEFESSSEVFVVVEELREYLRSYNLPYKSSFVKYKGQPVF